jgi:hypothetical protein
MHHVLKLLPTWSEKQDPRSGTLLARGAVEDESPVRLGEDQSFDLQLAVIRSPWVARRRCPVCHKVTST